MLMGLQGISLPIDQYNALLAAAPLLETVLAGKEEKVVRPNYGGEAVDAKEEDDVGDDEEAQEDEE